MDTVNTMKANKHVLMEQIRKYGAKPVTRDRAEYLSVCRGAYKAVCLAMEDMEDGSRHAESAVRVDRKTAEEWVSGMENADGTRGAHWPMEKTEEVRRQRGVAADPLEWWVTMNMMYSDYCVAAEKLGASSAEFFVCLSKAFLDDKDAHPEKLARYYEYVVRH